MKRTRSIRVEAEKLKQLKEQKLDLNEIVRLAIDAVLLNKECPLCKTKLKN